MLGLITSDTVSFAVVVGIPVAVGALAVIWAQPPQPAGDLGAVSLAIVVISAAGLIAALRGGPGLTQSAEKNPALCAESTCISPTSIILRSSTIASFCSKRQTPQRIHFEEVGF